MSYVNITLKYPITSDGIKLSLLKLRRPKVRDMLAVEKDKVCDAEKEINLFANLCEMRPDDLLGLDMADYAQLQKAYQDFLS